MAGSRGAIAHPRIYIIGGPGSGKTTLAKDLAALAGSERFDLDGYAWNPDPPGGLKPVSDLDGVVAEIQSNMGWIAEGIYHGWTDDLIDSADLVVWLDPPWPVAVWRVFVRHVRAELRRNNPHPGWMNLLRFLRATRRYYVAGAFEKVAEHVWSRATTEPYVDQLGARMMRVPRAGAEEVLARLARLEASG